VSAADLDLRGAGDLFGEQQAGHLRAVGTELYQHLLTQAVARQRGDAPPASAAELHIELAGRIPESYVPEENLRIGLLRRLARLSDLPGLREFADELEDRFGPPPPETARLLTLQRLRIVCRAHRILRVDAGPQACALTLAEPPQGRALAEALGGAEKEGRVLIPLAQPDKLARVEALTAALGG
jgi:transcription-repair coupling factor (superfamily II helicase)